VSFYRRDAVAKQLSTVAGGRRDGRGAAAAVGRPVAKPVRGRAVGRMAAALLAGRREVLPDIPARVPVPGDDGTGAAAGPQGLRGVRVSAGQCTQRARLAVPSAVSARRTVRRRTVFRARTGQVCRWSADMPRDPTRPNIRNI